MNQILPKQIKPEQKTHIYTSNKNNNNNGSKHSKPNSIKALILIVTAQPN